ncbi:MULTISPECIES: fluoride efflux transporter CrcB [Oceanobacillus]|uniref:Fluoride-specific ion channel FluC n=1 Tax=Oceanobacillus kimchii TaxID=746691 RepID=A0ABQ5TKJ4_9BACI|nr:MULTISPECIES: fluoride efflux transporter CrcB [Oceanobacillus]MBT2600322.1 fluoride efflux transporter CrcB [Oceanobacillus sp. ISL-74]MBT2650480.1 fluoride efflux transporter CrcB [Oceanobacillus sp. ISL-73]GLO67371.1 putative fluoride ion transporter CrcB [Oceanobacillus kimchii]
MKNVLIVMLGGFIGSILRYLLGEWMSSNSGFPIGTFFINLIGCFALGWLLTFFARKHYVRKEWSLLFGTGLLGSYTTFSTFSVETILLLQSAEYMLAVIYVLGSVVLGVGLAYFGACIALTSKKEEGMS